MFFRLYKNLISPLSHAFLVPLTGQSTACRFSPTCSEYSHQAVSKYGIIRGSVLSIKRLIRCHPWSSGGYDPVP